MGVGSWPMVRAWNRKRDDSLPRPLIAYSLAGILLQMGIDGLADVTMVFVVCAYRAKADPSIPLLSDGAALEALFAKFSSLLVEARQGTTAHLALLELVIS